MTHKPQTCTQCDRPVAHHGLCNACIADLLDDSEPEPDDGFPFECGMMRDGTCSLAGTEDCDWECPRNV